MSTPENNNRKWLVAAWPGMGQVGSIAAGFLIHALGAKPVEDLPARGYFDMGSVLNVVSNIAPPAAKIVDELGLKGIKSVTFASGFDGPAERSIVEVDIPGPRKGLSHLRGVGVRKEAGVVVPVGSTCQLIDLLPMSQARSRRLSIGTTSLAARCT